MHTQGDTHLPELHGAAPLPTLVVASTSLSLIRDDQVVTDERPVDRRAIGQPIDFLAAEATQYHARPPARVDTTALGPDSFRCSCRQGWMVDLGGTFGLITTGESDRDRPAPSVMGGWFRRSTSTPPAHRMGPNKCRAHKQQSPAGKWSSASRSYQQERCGFHSGVDLSGQFANRRLSSAMQEFLDLAACLA